MKWSTTPVIGICAARGRFQGTEGDPPVDFLPAAYTSAVDAADGICVLLPQSTSTPIRVNEVLDIVNGVIVTGGPDLHPTTYGETSGSLAGGFDVPVQEYELALVRAALDRNIPLLGIGRGMQVLNVALGGTVGQAHRGAVSAEHRIRLEAGSRLAASTGELHLVVNYHADQEVGVLADGLRVSGVSVRDGIARAIEHSQLEFVVGVQWHPEPDQSSTIVAALVMAARRATTTSFEWC
ncbi:gamma-glutamyl-gamma-aminobutyrate hydrolase family protein [Longivirga aurantiaca]|uniref:Gamma-glutamyl-gamma-aminobutyrate hydrolase family protein n=1 Tax=Longivirga aurantiaca TaxID=1837743 RepID=A0ABW1T3J3_9ACTN